MATTKKTPKKASKRKSITISIDLDTLDKLYRNRYVVVLDGGDTKRGAVIRDGDTKRGVVIRDGDTKRGAVIRDGDTKKGPKRLPPTRPPAKKTPRKKS